MSRVGRAVDHLVAIFSPQAALRRTFWREAYAKRSQYAAAKSPRTIGGWSPVDSPVNTVLGNSLAGAAVGSRLSHPRPRGRDRHHLHRG